MSYSSIFDSNKIITIIDLCRILNLDSSRIPLEFSAEEIIRAFKLRALQFHPDKQSTNNLSIPEETCNLLMHDIQLAKEYMLKGEDNIPGKAFLDETKEEDGISFLIEMLHAIKEGTSQLPSLIIWLNRLSNRYVVWFPLSTFSNSQLNFRFINQFSNKLKVIRPWLEKFDANSFINFVSQFKDNLENESWEPDSLLEQIKNILPVFDESKPEQYAALRAAIQDTRNELKNVLTDDFIAKLKHIIQFWPNLIATLPSWADIIGVYFISLLFTSTSLLRYFNAFKTILEVIHQQKGIVPLVLIALPATLLAMLMLPVNMVLQLSAQLTLIAFRTAAEVISSGFKLLVSLFNLLPLFASNNSFSQKVFSLVENLLKITLRLSINIIFETLDTLIFLIADNKPLSVLQSSVNEALDRLFIRLRPHNKSQEQSLIPLLNDDPEYATENPPRNGPGFFANSNPVLHNKEDVFLKELLRNIAAEQAHKQEAEDTSGIAMNVAP